MSARPLDSYWLGEYVYVREEVRAGHPQRWRLAIVTGVHVWRSRIPAQQGTDRMDTLGPLSCEVTTSRALDKGDFAHGSCVTITRFEDILPRDEVGSWAHVLLAGDIAALVESRRKDGGS